MLHEGDHGGAKGRLKSHDNEGSTGAIFYALGATFAIAVAKYVAAFWTGSGSMLAEAIHSTADCANQLLLLPGLKQARRPASADFPLGHRRITCFWSMIVALLLFFMGGAFSVYEGVVLLVIAIAVMIEVKGLIVGESAAPQLRAEIEPFVAAQREVEQVLDVITLA